MIVEHEVIEQVETEETGRSLSWVCDLIISLGRDKPFDVLRGMWRDGLLLFVNEHGVTLPDWKCEQLLREKDITSLANVVATAKGVDFVYDSTLEP